MKTKQDNDVIDLTGAVYSENNTDCHDWSDRVPSMKKTK